MGTLTTPTSASTAQALSARRGSSIDGRGFRIPVERWQTGLDKHNREKQGVHPHAIRLHEGSQMAVNVQDEVAFALDEGKLIIPIFYLLKQN